MIRIHSRFVFVMCIGGALSFLSCGGDDQPANPTPPTTQSPAPAPSPTPSATPTPSNPSAASRACSGPPATGSLNACGRRSDPQLLATLSRVLDGVRGQRDLFYPDGRTIRYLDRFREAVVAGLDAQGICGIFDYGDNSAGPGDIVYVRTSDNRVSEAYDVITGSGQPWTGYQNSCEPASQQPPYQQNYSIKDPGCTTIPPSREAFCLGLNFDSEYSEDVRSSIQAVITEQPELFDLRDSLSQPLSYRLTNPRAYVEAVIAKVRQKGYCAFEDGELNVKKDRSMNESFDIVRTPGNLEGQYSMFVYKGRCHNSLF